MWALGAGCGMVDVRGWRLCAGSAGGQCHEGVRPQARGSWCVGGIEAHSRPHPAGWPLFGCHATSLCRTAGWEDARVCVPDHAARGHTLPPPLPLHPAVEHSTAHCCSRACVHGGGRAVPVKFVCRPLPPATHPPTRRHQALRCT